MSIFFYCPWHDKNEWIKQIKKKFTRNKIVTLNDKPNFLKIKYAIIWELPNNIYNKLVNVKLIFSMGAGVDHIINLPSYNNIPIVRLKDPLMAERMSNHVISQILQYQLNLKSYLESQRKKQWKNFVEPVPNSTLKIGVLGVGFLGSYVGETLLNLGYKVQGYKLSKPKKNYKYPIFFKTKDLNKFISDSDILISILPATPKTNNFIDIKFLKLMKKNALLINVGRGSLIKEEDLVNFLKKNKFFNVSLDVFNVEPLPKKHPFWNLPNVTITPHVASVTAIDSAVNHMYLKYKNFQKNRRFVSDVDLKKRY